MKAQQIRLQVLLFLINQFFPFGRVICPGCKKSERLKFLPAETFDPDDLVAQCRVCGWRVVIKRRAQESRS